MGRWRTIRQHRRRARKGQVSAVATVLGLLLVVTFISNFIILQIPGEVAQVELAHVLQVEDQMSRLQATIYAQAAQGASPLALISPITLGSQPYPPFVPAASGSIASEGTSISAATSYIEAQLRYAFPNWNNGSTCLQGGGGLCSSNGNFNYWNLTAQNHTTVKIKIAGGNNALQYNLSANNDTIAIDWTGKDTSYVNIVINGSNDVVWFNKSGADNTAPIANFFFFGQYDTFNYDPAGGGARGSTNVSVEFVGALSHFCPASNLSATDHVGVLGAAPKGAFIKLNVTWWNSVGYLSGPASRDYPGGAIPLQTVNWANQSGFHLCAFQTADISHVQSQFLSGLSVHLNNRYSPGTDIAFDGGAVIADQIGGTPVMVNPPRISFAAVPGGTAASITLVNLVGNPGTVGGIATTAVSTRIVSVSTSTVQNISKTGNAVGAVIFAIPAYLNMTTLYPEAWVTWLESLNTPALVYGIHCVAPGTLSAPYTCLEPPPGVAVKLTVPLFLKVLTLTVITVDISLA